VKIENGNKNDKMKNDFHFQKSIFKKGCLKNRADENGTFLIDSPFPQC
jgi:hypothetical protein